MNLDYWPHLSVFGTDGALQGIPRSAFGRTSTLITAQWFVRSTPGQRELDMFGPLDRVIPYGLRVCGGCIALGLSITSDCWRLKMTVADDSSLV